LLLKKQMEKPGFTGLITALACAAILASCGGRAYVHETPESQKLGERAETQSEGPIRVSAAVPGREETEAIFGIDLYDQGVQPVWLEIENSGDVQVRYAPVSTDRFYYSPMEVAYKNRGGYSDEARADMQRYFDQQAMPRYVDPGETRSGFVFTHADTGAKGFNVDVFSADESHHFTFLLRVPGFVPDYANIDFDSIYSADELSVYEGDTLYAAIKNLPCCSTDADGNRSEATLNVVLVGAGRELLTALLRSRWVETSAAESTDRAPDFLFGRKQDAIFRYESRADDSVYELRLWLSPMLSGKDRVWVGQVRHFYSYGAFTRFDPDVDNARSFALQHLIYGQALERLAWVSGEAVVPVESFWRNLIRPAFFTDGYRIVLWLSEEPVSLEEIIAYDWDTPPGHEK
jgi:hypothetical protein